MNWKKEREETVKVYEAITLLFTLNDTGKTMKTLVSTPGFTFIIQIQYIPNKNQTFHHCAPRHGSHNQIPHYNILGL
jgi:hypothetical protein